MNVIFTNQPIWKTVQGFDIPLCRAALYGKKGKLSKQFDPVVLQDFVDRKLTPPTHYISSRTVRRMIKYCSRYGMTVRNAEDASCEKGANHIVELLMSIVSSNLCAECITEKYPKLEAEITCIMRYVMASRL
jgi:hypothetical protein